MPKQPYSYNRRNEVARSLGFKNYSERRKALESLKGNSVWENLPGKRSERATVEKQLAAAEKGDASKKDWRDIFDYVSEYDDYDYDDLRDWYDSQ